jgi:hypothetical protein
MTSTRCFCFFLVFAICSATCPMAYCEWEPPEKPDPDVIFDEAQADARAGRYEDALAKHLWFHHHALEYEPALYGVRLSFAVSAWLRLGQEYPPAMDELKKVRDQARKQALGAEENVRESFHEMYAINDILGEQKQTVEVFVRLDKKSPELAAKVYGIAEEELVKDKKYKLCGKYLTPEKTVDRLLKIYDLDQEYAARQQAEQKKWHLEYAENSLTEHSARLIAILVLNERKDEAEKVAERIRTKAPSESREKAISAALRGELLTTDK